MLANLVPRDVSCLPPHRSGSPRRRRRAARREGDVVLDAHARSPASRPPSLRGSSGRRSKLAVGHSRAGRSRAAHVVGADVALGAGGRRRLSLCRAAWWSRGGIGLSSGSLARLARLDRVWEPVLLVGATDYLVEERRCTDPKYEGRVRAGKTLGSVVPRPCFVS